MLITENFNPKKTKVILGYDKNFDFFNNLITTKNFPKVILLTGDKGIGKSTFIFHFLHYLFNKKNYDFHKKEILSEDVFFIEFKRNLFPNIIYLNGADNISIKVENIRDIKNKLLKSPLNDNKRFIILDDVEIYNTQSINALLKMIEEPNKSNYFILINNKSKPIINTLKSRCIEIKIILKEKDRLNIIKSLFRYFNQEIISETNLPKTSPGNLLKFNYFFRENDFDIHNDLLSNINILLNSYKKTKEIFYKDLMIFYSEFYLQKNDLMNSISLVKKIENKNILLKNINDFFLNKINQSSFLNSLENKFINE